MLKKFFQVIGIDPKWGNFALDPNELQKEPKEESDPKDKEPVQKEEPKE